MEENLVIEFPNGETYTVPKYHVAIDRATYYAREDDTVDMDVFDEEFEYAMENDVELLDWAGNNMDWEDLKAPARRLPSEKEDLSEQWSDADLEIRKI